MTTRVLKNHNKGGNGDVIVVTDARDLEEFGQELADVIVAFVEAYPDDLEHDLGCLVPNAINIAARFVGHPAERVSRHFVAGYSTPDECTLLVGKDTGPI